MADMPTVLSAFKEESYSSDALAKLTDCVKKCAKEVGLEYLETAVTYSTMVEMKEALRE